MFTQSDIYKIYRDILIFSYRIYIITQHTIKKNNIHQSPHKFQHLAKQAGTLMEAISEALTRSDSGTTQIYVNISNVVPMAVGEFALKSLKQ